MQRLRLVDLNDNMRLILLIPLTAALQSDCNINPIAHLQQIWLAIIAEHQLSSTGMAPARVHSTNTPRDDHGDVCFFESATSSPKKRTQAMTRARLRKWTNLERSPRDVDLRPDIIHHGVVIAAAIYPAVTIRTQGLQMAR